jgi:glyoxylase-like metal-dependent hydrolase (beta-lactamase superfamily II)
MRIPAPIHRFILKQFVGQTRAYFNAPPFRGSEVEQVSERVYTFRWGWYRNVFVVTDAGVVATDPFNPEAATLLRQAIRDKAGDRPVKQLFYTHYHRDHTEGGAALEAEEIVAYQGCSPYFDDLNSPDIARPTRTISGDQTVEIGGVTFDLLYLGKTHTDTLYAVHLPQEGVLFTADFGMVRAFPPVGYPDFYRPGVVRAAERLSRLDFESFVPSHFGWGSKRDFLDFWEMFRRLDEATRDAGTKFGRPDQRPVEAFAEVYDRIRADYGHWHGFDQMILFSAVRTVTGQLLGY